MRWVILQLVVVFASSAPTGTYRGAITNKPYVVDGALNISNFGNGSAELAWFWQHNSAGETCVSEGGMFTWTSEGSKNVTIGSAHADYYFFVGALYTKHGSTGLAGDLRNADGVVGSWDVVLDGPSGAPCVHPHPIPTPRPAPTPNAPAPSNVGPITWWFDIDSNWEQNLAAIRDHPKAFQIVQPGYAGAFGADDPKLPLDDRVWMWWGHDAAIARWRDPLKALGLKIKPYVTDIDHFAQMHRVWANSTAWIADAVAIALHYQFDGWFIDYGETPVVRFHFHGTILPLTFMEHSLPSPAHSCRAPTFATHSQSQNIPASGQMRAPNMRSSSMPLPRRFTRTGCN
jgi:hypothetical protein